MKNAENHRRYLGGLLCLLCMLFSTRLMAATGEMTLGDTEPTFPVLQTKAGSYTNVTVTKRTKEWIFILHSKGVCNVKASDLSTEARIALGYEKPADQKVEEAKLASASSQPLAQLTHIKLAEIQKFATGWRTNGKEKVAEAKTFFTSNPQLVCLALGIVGGVYVFVSVCFWSICRKTHIAPGPLIWVPILQLIPLLRAANMPRVWFFAFFIPVLNIIAQIVWCVKIVKTRGKNPWVAFLLVMPPTSLFAFLYLALSRSAPVEIHRTEILALETA